MKIVSSARIGTICATKGAGSEGFSACHICLESHLRSAARSHLRAPPPRRPRRTSSPRTRTTRRRTAGRARSGSSSSTSARAPSSAPCRGSANPHAHSSANFVVGRTGHVQELVPLHDIAWHAGNWAYNIRSVGIENEGYTERSGGLHGAGVPRDRPARRRDRAAVADPDRPPAHHRPLPGAGPERSAPGRRHRQSHRSRAALEVDPTSCRLVRALRVSAALRAARAHRPAGRVEHAHGPPGDCRRSAMANDGRRPRRSTCRSSSTARCAGPTASRRTRSPAGSDCSTPSRCATASTPSRSAPTARSRGRGSASSVRVRNEPFTLAPVDLKAKQQVSGVVPVQAVFTGVAPARVLLYLDGRQIDHDTSAPYLFKWDTRRTTDGLHTVTLAGRARDGRIVRSRVQVRVANGAAPREDRRRLARRRSDGVRASSTGSSRRAAASRASSSSSTASCARRRRSSVCLRLGHECARRRARTHSLCARSAGTAPSCEQALTRDGGAGARAGREARVEQRAPTAMPSAAPPAPSPATPLPIAAAATPSTISVFPSGRRRNERSATHDDGERAERVRDDREQASPARTRGGPAPAGMPVRGERAVHRHRDRDADAQARRRAGRTPPRGGRRASRSEPTPSSGAVRSAPAA